MNKALHVICFDNPYPANYGGAIDVFYKLKELKAAGVYVKLHVFLYGERTYQSEKLEAVADEIYYYNRNTGWLANISFLPYIVNSRNSKELLSNLLQDNLPILFEGLHSCFFIAHPALRNRQKWVRCHNVEHEYYHYLQLSTSVFWKKLYFFVERLRLAGFEKRLVYANALLPISVTDESYYKTRFPRHTVKLLPCFSNVMSHSTRTAVTSQPSYFLYHGNLEVIENQQAALYLIDKVLPLLNNRVHFIIAGKNPSVVIQEKVSQTNGVQLIANPTDNELNELIAAAKANVLITFQPTGIKLKLLNALYIGGFCVVNKDMLYGTQLEEVCIEANSAMELAQAIEKSTKEIFTEEMRSQRLILLAKRYSNAENIQVLLKLINGD